MKVVYVLQSIPLPSQSYVGVTDHLKRRLAKHNAGLSPHTAKYRPWRVVVAVQFEDDAMAVRFERYLKSGSGHAFLKRHFWPSAEGSRF